MRDIQKKIFISHSSDDEETVSKFEEIFEGLKDFEIFYSSKPEIGIEAGEELLSRIDVELEKCDYFFMIVTDSYLRSKYCLYEFNIAQYLYKKNIIEKIIPIFKNSEMQDYVSEFIPNTLFIDASNSNCASVFLKTMQTIFLITDFESESIIDKVETFFTKLNNTTVCNRNFIGMSFDEFNDIFLACRKNGITRISNSFFDSEYVKDNANQVDEIIILSTTGTALIKSIANTIINPALKNGAKIKVLIPNQHSDFCNDVADIELPQDEQHLRRKSIADEYDATINFLIEQYLKVQSELGDKKPAGSIICYCTFNILRQTIFLTKKGGMPLGVVYSDNPT